MSRVGESAWGDTPLGRYPESPGYKEPTTSRDAAAAIKGKAAILKEKIMAVYSAAGSAGLTADEAAARLGEDWRAVRPRVSELREAGRLVRTGRRRANDTGLKAHVLRVP